MKKLTKIITIFIFFLSVCLNCQIRAFACTEVLEANGVWGNFRKTFPFHIQTLAYDTQNEILVVSEPPPHVNLIDLKKIAPELNQIDEKQHTIGCDGWVKDLVIKIPQMSDLDRQDLFDRINLYLFHTTYKSNILDLTAKRDALNNSETPLDITVTFTDIKDWLIDKNENFESNLTGEIIPFNTIISQKKNGVFFSEDPGLVIWAIDRKSPLSNNKAEIRQFSLDSDLIIGSISDANTLVIIGRKRLLPLDMFPPLRTETILQLASIKNPNLAQSYERNYVFAGRFNEKDDWAPIYLSDELIDTEYGSLLNITDQILKRWSMKGTVSYTNFTSYKDPDTFPFGDKTLVEQLNNVLEVTFNWNTLGVGYSSEVEGKRIFALNRTGSLPSSYLSKDQENFLDVEEIGYNYFSKIGDPNLTRVVQYAALYQIFQDVRVTAGKDAFSFEPYSPNYEGLYQELVKITNRIKTTSSDEILNLRYSPNVRAQEFAESIIKVKEFSNKTEFEAVLRSMLDPRNLNNQFNKKIDAYYKEYRRLNNELKSLESSRSQKVNEAERQGQAHIAKTEEFNSICPGTEITNATPLGRKCNILFTEKNKHKRTFDQLIVTITNLDRQYISAKEQILRLQSSYGVFTDFNDAVKDASKEFVSSEDSNRLKDIYLKSLPKRNSKWLHTPSIVVSSNDNIRSVGGHNLDSRLTPFKVGIVPPGKVKIISQGAGQVIIVNPKDVNKVSSLVRTFAKNSKTGDINVAKKELEKQLATQPVIKPQPKNSALKLSNQPLVTDSKKGNLGWFSNKKIKPSEDDVITITKLEDGSNQVSYKNREITAYTITSLNDYLVNIKYGGKDPARIRMVGYDLNDAGNLKTNLEFKGNLSNEKPKLIQTLKDFGGKRSVKDFDFANAKISIPEFEIIGKGPQAQTKVSIDIEIPLLSKKNGLYLRFQNIFKGAITKIRQQQISKRFESLFKTKFSGIQDTADSEVDAIILEIQKEIKMEFLDITDVKFFLYEDATVSEKLEKFTNNERNAE